MEHHFPTTINRQGGVAMQYALFFFHLATVIAILVVLQRWPAFFGMGRFFAAMRGVTDYRSPYSTIDDDGLEIVDLINENYRFALGFSILSGVFVWVFLQYVVFFLLAELAEFLRPSRSFSIYGSWFQFFSIAGGIGIAVWFFYAGFTTKAVRVHTSTEVVDDKGRTKIKDEVTMSNEVPTAHRAAIFLFGRRMKCHFGIFGEGHPWLAPVIMRADAVSAESRKLFGLDSLDLLLQEDRPHPDDLKKLKDPDGHAEEEIVDIRMRLLMSRGPTETFFGFTVEIKNMDPYVNLGFNNPDNLLLGYFKKAARLGVNGLSPLQIANIQTSLTSRISREEDGDPVWTENGSTFSDDAKKAVRKLYDQARRMSIAIVSSAVDDAHFNSETQRVANQLTNEALELPAQVQNANTVLEIAETVYDHKLVTNPKDALRVAMATHGSGKWITLDEAGNVPGQTLTQQRLAILKASAAEVLGEEALAA